MSLRSGPGISMELSCKEAAGILCRVCWQRDAAWQWKGSKPWGKGVRGVDTVLWEGPGERQRQRQDKSWNVSPRQNVPLQGLSFFCLHFLLKMFLSPFLQSVPFLPCLWLVSFLPFLPCS